MTTRTYQGSCYCRRVTFEADIDLAAGTTRCNCTSCFKRRWWGVSIKPAQFRLLAGEAELVKLKPAKGPGGYCRHCAVTPFASGDAAEWNDGDYVSINVASLDGLDPSTLAAIPVTYLDGLHDTWAPLTENTSYL
jgi:hypothetical protein